MDIGHKIKELRKQRGLSQSELAKIAGYNDRSSIAKIESGSVDLPRSKILVFSRIFNISPAELLGVSQSFPSFPRNIIPLPKLHPVPLVGTIACGSPILAEENLEGNVNAPADVHADFALRCQGDSMINARIFDGDLVYIRQQETVESGQIAAVLIDDEATLKRVRLYDDRIILEPENPQYKPLVYYGSEMESIRILGLAVAFVSEVR